MTKLTIEGVTASTRPMEAYGGVRIPETVVRALAESLAADRISWGLHHDPRLKLDAHVLEAFVREDSDGYLEAVVRFEVDEHEWNKPGGAGASTTGFSGVWTQPMAGLGDGLESPAIWLQADPHWFPDADIADAFHAFDGIGTQVKASRRYHFASDPPALAVLLVALQQLETVPAAVLASYIYDSLRRLLGRHERATKFSVTFDGESGRMTHAYLETTSEGVLKHAIDILPVLMQGGGDYEFSPDAGEWRPLG